MITLDYDDNNKWEKLAAHLYIAGRENALHIVMQVLVVSMFEV